MNPIKQLEIYPKKTKVFERLYLLMFGNPNIANTSIVILQGGTSSSKTVSVMQILCLLALEKKVSIAVFASRTASLLSGTIRDLEMVISDSEFVKSHIVFNRKTEKFYLQDAAGYIVTFTNGSKMRFAAVGTDSESGKAANNSFRKVRELGKFHYTYFNEANNCARIVFESIRMRTTIRMFVDFNADTDFYIHHIYRPQYILEQEIGDDTKTALLDAANSAHWDISNYQDNPYCSENVIQDLLRYRDSDYNRWRVYGLGCTGSLPSSNKFFYAISRTKNKGVCNISPHNELVFSFDFNHKNMVVLIAQTSENIVGKIHAPRFYPISDSEKSFLHVVDEVVIAEPPSGKSTIETAVNELIARYYDSHIKKGKFICVGDLSGQSGSALSADSCWQAVFGRLGGIRSNYIVAKINPSDNRYPKANPTHRDSFNISNNVAYSLGERLVISERCKVTWSDIDKAKIKGGKSADKYGLYKDTGEYNMNAADCLRYLIYYAFFNLSK